MTEFEAMEPAEELRLAIEWYLESIPPGSLLSPGPPIQPGEVESTIAEIDEAIAPFRLPSEVAWLWRSWQPDRFSPLPYPSLTGADFALDSWRMNTLESGDPQILFPVAYESHGFLLVELGWPPDEPAPIWYYAYADENYVLTYPSLASLFRACAEAARAAGARPPDDDNDRYAAYAPLLSGPGFDVIVERHMAASPHAGRDRHVPVGDVRNWPEQWQRAQGVSDGSLEPMGATHTVREFAGAAAVGPVVGRVVGVFRTQGGGGFGRGGALASFGSFSDETGSIPVLLPHSVTDVGGRAGDVEVEIELEASGPVGESPVLDSREIQGAALAGDLLTASEKAGELGVRVAGRDGAHAGHPPHGPDAMSSMNGCLIRIEDGPTVATTASSHR